VKLLQDAPLLVDPPADENIESFFSVFSDLHLGQTTFLSP
jgi:hypothetical protein